MARRRVTKHVEVRPGKTAIAPKVDDPRGFAIDNQSSGPLTVSFNYDFSAHIMSVVVEERRPTRRPPGELDLGSKDQTSADLPA